MICSARDWQRNLNGTPISHTIAHVAYRLHQRSVPVVPCPVTRAISHRCHASQQQWSAFFIAYPGRPSPFPAHQTFPPLQPTTISPTVLGLMRDPHHHGSADALHRQHGLPPVSPMQSDYPMPQFYHPQLQYFIYGRGSGLYGSGLTAGSSFPDPYTSQYMPIEQRPPQINVNVAIDPATPTITFGCIEAPQQSDQVQQSYYSSVNFDGGAGPSSVDQESGTFGSFQTTAVGGPRGSVHPPPQERPALGQQASLTSKRTTKLTTKRTTKRVSGSATTPGEPSRVQYTACGGCRHRRVKCDLRTRKADAERNLRLEEAKGGGQVPGRQPSCSNCVERGTNCV